MKRLRWGMATLLVLLWVPIYLLVRHALDNVEAERLGRHQEVAERLFDEMERELTEWLGAEEQRPFGHYRFIYIPEGQDSTPERSPLADGPKVPFVFAHYQIDADGRVSSPLWPQDADRAERVLGWRMEPGQERQRNEILDVLSTIVLNRITRSLPEPEPVTQQMSRSELKEQRKKKSEPDLLSRLNRGLESRSGRTTQVQQSPVQNVLDFTESEDISGLSSRLTSLRQSMNRPADSDQADPSALVNVSLEPMVGRPVDGTVMMLYRTVVIGDRAFRQGMVVDGQILVDWLSGRVLSAENEYSKSSRRSLVPISKGPRSPGAAVTWEDPESYGRGREVGPTYLAFRHRFAEPFASVGARVELEPLPEPSTALYIYSLAALLAFSSTLGMWALYRTVAARLRFAERQNNFVSAVTHELKTPLTAIRMHGEMLRDGVVPSEEKRQGYYRVLTAEAERLTRLIDNVLELSQIEKQTRRFHLRPQDARQTLKEVAEVLEPHAQKQGFVLELEDDGPAEAVYDSDALAQVIFNLVDNALKYASSEQKIITLRSENRGKHIHLTVADRGPGVPRNQTREIFQPFYRGENEMTRTTKGTGIGLSLVRGLVEPMGGSVHGRNRDAGGFAVEIRLPGV